MKEAVFSKRQEYWNSIIAEQKRSGLSQAKFCEERKISKSSFSYWISASKKSDRASFAKVELARCKTDNPLKIDFPNGVSLQFAEVPDAKWLTELMRYAS